MDRRSVLRHSAVAGTAAMTMNVANTQFASAAETTSSEPLKIGLVGCGGRGTGAAAHALSTGNDVQLVAMADAFVDRLEGSLSSLLRGKPGVSKIEAGNGFGNAIDVPPERRFTGLDAYRKLIDSEVDLVILTGPPGFRPAHFRYAVAAGKHVFMEKPVASTPSGIRAVLEDAMRAKEKNLKVGVGLQRHHQDSYLTAMEKIHGGVIGRVTAMRCFWNASAPAKTPVPREDMTELEYQIRNWYFFDFLSGDHICEQHIHNIDVCNWAMQDHPVSAEGMGGRQVRVEPRFGNIYDHHAVLFSYANGTPMHSYCRQIPGCKNYVGEVIEGSRGRANLGTGASSLSLIDETGTEKELWRTPRQKGKDYQSPYQVEWNTLIEAVLSDQPYNEVEYSAHSTMSAIMGRMATYSGKVIQWDEALASGTDEIFDPLSFDDASPVPAQTDGTYAIPTPGKTKVL
ncbi:Inositol 2-dehydrogenase [Stieleria varia]|uniref:Inositol 2-dehydrogenase n=2 Tax=Stieleria varia TaxID=2528005 RepID=A0A5C6AWX3_9BACT|nr:Inositol 2-dehydrogenase [Stieleria varia]